MPYVKQTWVNGEVITDTKLNHMEDGIASSGGSDSDIFLVKVTASGSDENPTFTADKTLQEVYEAFSNKKLVMTNEGYVLIVGSAGFSRTYVSGTVLVSDTYMYYMDEEDDDPSPDETRLEKTTDVFQLQPLV